MGICGNTCIASFLLGISFMKIRKKIKQEPFYGYYMKGLIAKLLSALFFV
jgi:hypothetical protein